MTDTTNGTTAITNSTNGSTSTDGSNLSIDADATQSTDKTTENTAVNDPIKNKKLAGVTMMEPLRSLLDFTVTLPGTFKGLHTNQFCWLEVGDDFYDKFYSDIANTIGNTKFSRYAGFKEGRFYIEGVKTRFDLNDGITTELTLNPFASMYSEYIKMQQSAERTLQEALQPKGGGSTTTGTTNASGNDCTGHTQAWDIGQRSPTEKGLAAIGNSSANYAELAKCGDPHKAADTMKAKMTYHYYTGNAAGSCPRELYAASHFTCNCCDISRMMKCIYDVMGIKNYIFRSYLSGGHFWNRIEYNGSWMNVDLCTTPWWGNVASHWKSEANVGLNG